MTAPTAALSAALADATRPLHREAERAGVMRRILRRRFSRREYCLLMRNLHAVYAAMEPALRERVSPADLAPLSPLSPELARVERLGRDLDVLCGSGWGEALPLLPPAAGQAYLEIAARAKDIVAALDRL